jgi:hypothetical protein
MQYGARGAPDTGRGHRAAARHAQRLIVEPDIDGRIGAGQGLE